MKSLIEAIKGMAINMVIGQLEANKKQLATKIAAQVDIPFVKESDEIKLAEGVLSAVKDVIEGMGKK
tara:strand:- start:3818 stop:4018 length:201 start_codon:yes stop_codon:yes gene_type:complete